MCLRDAKVPRDKIDDILLVGGMTRTPKVIDVVKKFFGKEPNRGINPDEAVALGAAIQAGVLEGGATGVILLDVTPLSLGIETLGGVFTRLITKNTSIPVKKTMTFSTAADNQTEVEIKVLQGEREIAMHNRILGQFHLVGILPARKGVPKIDVTFDIDADGIVHVSAKDQATGKEKQIRVQSSGGLTEQDIQRMLDEAKAHEEEDKKHKEAAETTNRAQSTLFELGEQIREHKDKLDPTLLAELEAEMKELSSMVDSHGEPSAIKEKHQQVTDKSHALFAKMYESSNQSNQNNQNNQSNPNEPQDADVKK